MAEFTKLSAILAHPSLLIEYFPLSFLATIQKNILCKKRLIKVRRIAKSRVSHTALSAYHKAIFFVTDYNYFMVY